MLKVQGQGVGKAMLPLKATGENLLHAFLLASGIVFPWLEAA